MKKKIKKKKANHKKIFYKPEVLIYIIGMSITRSRLACPRKI